MQNVEPRADSFMIEALRSRAEIERLRKPGKAGRPKHSERELRRLGDIYVNMRTTSTGKKGDLAFEIVDGCCVPVKLSEPQRWSTLRVPGQLGQLWEVTADQLEGKRDWDDLPAELRFVADCPAPMNHADALRNVAVFAEVKEKRALELLRLEDERRAAKGEQRLGLPPKRQRSKNRASPKTSGFAENLRV